MLTKLTLRGWKSFSPVRGIEVPLAPLTLLVGPNASGKSNVLDALRLLQGLALDLRLDEALRGKWDGGRQTWQGVRGGEAQAAWAGSTNFHLLTTLQLGGHEHRHLLEVRTAPELQIAREQLNGPAGDLFDTHAGSLGAGAGPQPGGALHVGYATTGAGKNGRMVVRSSASVLGQLESAERMRSDVVTTTKAVRAHLRSLLALELQPSRMRDPAPMSAATMGAAGENLAAALHHMPAADRRDLCDWLSELCAPKVTGLEFEVIDTVRDVYFLLEERGSARISSRSLSDGTLRFLGILVALLTTPAGTTLLLEEPDVGLHPTRIHLLAQLLEQIPARRGIQVLATTHSPTLLANLSQQVLADVVAFDRTDETDPTNPGSTVAKRLGDLQGFGALVASSQRDHLMATGWLERARRHAEAEESRTHGQAVSLTPR
jgi:predicted ATPase